MSPQAGPRFVDDPAAFTDASAQIVRIPGGVRAKRALLGEYARQLKLPQYFGWNWDALEDCLRDLTWLGEPRRVVIVHESVPLSRGRKTRRTYLRLLAEVVSFWQASGQREFAAVFPTASRQMVEELWPQ